MMAGAATCSSTGAVVFSVVDIINRKCEDAREGEIREEKREGKREKEHTVLRRETETETVFVEGDGGRRKERR
jgi:hypothetical protein